MNKESRETFMLITATCFGLLALAFIILTIVSVISDTQIQKLQDAEATIKELRAELAAIPIPEPPPMGGVEVDLKAVQRIIHPDDFIDYSSPYGVRRSPFTGDLVHHPGLDMYGTWHARIVAPGPGVVRDHWVPPGQAWGYSGHSILGGCLVLEMDDGAVITLGHLSETYVRGGDTFAVGDLLGRQGSTGISTGEHLHLEVTIGGRDVNPFVYFLGDEG